MNKKELRKALLEIIEEIIPETDLSNINDTKNLRDQTGLDSMDFLDIIMELRKRYSINVPEKDYEKLDTIQGCIEYLEPIIK